MTERIVRIVDAVQVQFGGETHQGWLPEGASMPSDTPRIRALLNLRVIELASGGYLLHWRPSQRQQLEGPPFEGDTWHACIEDALEQAQLMFDVAPAKWRSTDLVEHSQSDA